MKFRMGLDINPLMGLPDEELTKIAPLLPQRAMISEDDWQSIVNYFSNNAPDSLLIENPITPDTLQQFDVSEVRLPVKHVPLITLVKFDSARKQLFVGDRFSKLYQLNNKFTLTDSIVTPSPASDIILRPRATPLILTMGIMDPNEQDAGRLSAWNTNNDSLTMMIDSIKRPVHATFADLDRDGDNDYVISAFGNFGGSLDAYEDKGSAGFTKHRIHFLPGTRKTIVRDLNADGLPDLVALITQGDEQITAYINEGNFKFSTKILLRFPPVYGSSYFDLADMNSDGHEDIVYSNGDNSDYSTILKPYHGLRIFLNVGKDKFSESWFHPMHGAFQFVVRDFDHDNDLDIAAISFFPDFSLQPEQSFLYFENNNLQFRASTTPLASNGRWIVMETADFDEDNDEDIILGALDFNIQVPQQTFIHWREKNTSLLVLQNNQIKVP